MPANPAAPDSVGVLFPSGMLGAGFTAESRQARHRPRRDGDRRSTPARPTPAPTTSAPASPRRPPARGAGSRMLLAAASGAGIPLIVGSCGTSGTDAGVDGWPRSSARSPPSGACPSASPASTASSRRGAVTEAIAAGRVRPLPTQRGRSDAAVESCAHIVGVMGHEPFAAALAAGAEVMLAGRATDTAMVAALALLRGRAARAGLARGEDDRVRRPVHDQPAQRRRLRRDRRRGLHRRSRSTPRPPARRPRSPRTCSTRTSNPFRLRRAGRQCSTPPPPPTTPSTSAPCGSRAPVRACRPPTAKLEGARRSPGTRPSPSSASSTRISSPTSTRGSLLAHGCWPTACGRAALARTREGRIAVRCYGPDAILGRASDTRRAASEVGVLLQVRAARPGAGDRGRQDREPPAAAPAAARHGLPAELRVRHLAGRDRARRVYEFALNHVVEVADPRELFRLEMEPRHA